MASFKLLRPTTADLAKSSTLRTLRRPRHAPAQPASAAPASPRVHRDPTCLPPLQTKQTVLKELSKRPVLLDVPDIAWMQDQRSALPDLRECDAELDEASRIALILVPCKASPQDRHSLKHLERLHLHACSHCVQQVLRREGRQLSVCRNVPRTTARCGWGGGLDALLYSAQVGLERPCT